MTTVERDGEPRTYDDFLARTADAPWGDGLPCAPIDDGALADALGRLELAADQQVAQFTSASASDLCSLALLAGCDPRYVPLVLGAVRALDAMVARSGFDTVLAADAAQAVIVNGPVRTQLDVNCGIGAFGPGWRANATIGRALRFIVRDAGVSHPPAFGDPAQYTLCFGEDEEGAVWQPLHVERGLAATQSAVTVHSFLKAGRNFDRVSATPEAHVERLAVFLRDPASGTNWFGDDPLSLLVVMSHEWRRQLVDAGWSKDDLRARLLPALVGDDVDGRPLHLGSPDDVVILGAGGPAEATEWCFVGRAGAPVTQLVPDLEAAS